jgi:hypothetical protein
MGRNEGIDQPRSVHVWKLPTAIHMFSFVSLAREEGSHNMGATHASTRRPIDSQFSVYLSHMLMSRELRWLTVRMEGDLRIRGPLTTGRNGAWQDSRSVCIEHCDLGLIRLGRSEVDVGSRD